ncbi:MAG TPA: hypothetical protein DD670_10050, partial [Planctomycetaceae bacterium]|nr:hypothetical protein [Planctomycetaceae bacterium]
MFYQVDGTRLPLRDHFRTYLRLRSILVWVILLPLVLVRKLFRIRHLYPAVISDTLEPFLVDPADIPEEVREKMEPLEADIRACGFVDPVYHWIVDPFGGTRMAVTTFRH